MEWDKFFLLVEKVGVPLTVLAFFAIAVWISLKWLAKDVLKPLIDRYADRLFKSADEIDSFSSRLSKVEQQVETLWEFTLRRAHVEALTHGVGKMNSPIVISDEAKSWLKDIADGLRALYRRLGRQVTNTELMMAIEREYGERIVKEVCIPHGLFQGACLLIAMQVAKEVEQEINISGINTKEIPNLRDGIIENK